MKITGIVQGVGFRPFVHRIASKLNLNGFVKNTSDGVFIEIEGERGSLDEFHRLLKSSAPPLSRISTIDIGEIAPLGNDNGFRIIESSGGKGFTLISPDAATCPDCLRELNDPTDRRYKYPFINCTNCGPRYSITYKAPYDRPNTTMKDFKMCSLCQAEYDNPNDRRFHAVPNACPDCGPMLTVACGPDETSAIAYAVRLIKQGHIVAVKGLGGFHIACDADNESTVNRLRSLKRKSNKPFALMASDLNEIKKHCHVSDAEEAELLSAGRPIVLLKKKHPQSLPDSLAPKNTRLGFMLPYTPMHHLLMDELKIAVMTSGNVADEPIVSTNNEADRVLKPMADEVITHDRDIYMRVDDSVVRLGNDGIRRIIRRSRGIAPEPIKLISEGPDVLGAGADLKNTFTILKGPYAIMSQHIGDMENIETLGFYEETLKNLKSVYRADPKWVAHDMHPQYLSRRWAIGQDMQKLPVQHHHAHIASVIAEHNLKGRVIGVALDGTGYGTDGNLWGGEIMAADLTGFDRVAHFNYTPLPGGESAVKEPWRAAIGAVCSIRDNPKDVLKRIGFYDAYDESEINNIIKISRIPEFSPLSSGAGRLFDIVSALIGICGFNTFEGEAAIALESIACDDITDEYPYDIFDAAPGKPMVIGFSRSLTYIIDDRVSRADTGVIAAKFHNTAASAVVDVVKRISATTGIDAVALSGGVFQNEILLMSVSRRLRESGLRVYYNEAVPTNDAGVSLGQAVILREHLKEPVK